MRLTSLLFCVVEVSLLLVLYKYYYAAVHHVFHGLNFVTIILLYVLDCGCFQDVLLVLLLIGLIILLAFV
jgi:hypothetical protein